VSEWSEDVDDKTPISITLAGGADDGRPGENDDVRSVEHIAVNLAGTYVGSEGPDDIRVRQVLDPVTMNGGAGDDQLRTADGPDTLDGGTGADYLDGGYGDDHITGGAGTDVIHGDIAGGDCGGGIYGYCKLPYGNDTIDARDGEVDSIDCGAGTDTVLADADDVVAPDCETVQRGSAPSTGPAGPTTPNGPGVGIRVSAVKARLAKGLSLKVAVPGAGKLAVKATRAGDVLASHSMRTPSAGTATMHLRFRKAARRAVRHKLTVTVSFTPKGGAALKRTTKVTLRR
jgi:hypothetical protein